MVMRATFEETQHFQIEFIDTTQQFKADFGSVQVVTQPIGGKMYTGDYEVTPKVNAQTMPTRDKFMAKDVTINPIPIYRVSNTSGGTTVYIAKEI